MEKWNHKTKIGAQKDWNQTLVTMLNVVSKGKISPIITLVPSQLEPLIKSLLFYNNGKIGDRYEIRFTPSDTNVIDVGGVELEIENFISISNMWKRYRFKTYSVEDNRPLVFNPKYPWWCSGSGYGENDKDNFDIIIAYLPISEDLLKYWDDAFDIEFTEENEITFSSRFPKPKYFIEE